MHKRQVHTCKICTTLPSSFIFFFSSSVAVVNMSFRTPFLRGNLTTCNWKEDDSLIAAFHWTRWSLHSFGERPPFWSLSSNSILNLTLNVGDFIISKVKIVKQTIDNDNKIMKNETADPNNPPQLYFQFILNTKFRPTLIPVSIIDCLISIHYFPPAGDPLRLFIIRPT